MQTVALLYIANTVGSFVTLHMTINKDVYLQNIQLNLPSMVLVKLVEHIWTQQDKKTNDAIIRVFHNSIEHLDDRDDVLLMDRTVTFLTLKQLKIFLLLLFL